MARGVLGFRFVRPGPHRRARRRPRLGRTRLHATARRAPQLAHPPFDDGAGRGTGSGAVRPPPSLRDRPEGLHLGIYAQPVRALDRTAGGWVGAASRAALFGPRARHSGALKTKRKPPRDLHAADPLAGHRRAVMISEAPLVMMTEPRRAEPTAVSNAGLAEATAPATHVHRSTPSITS